MKDEIKEILDNLKYTAKKHIIQVLEYGEKKIEHCPQEVATELRLNTYSANILLDYITNLQEENEKLKEQNNDLRKIYKNTYNRLFQNGNDELARYFQAQIDDCPTFYVEPIIDYVKEWKDYKSRNEKANALLDEMLEKAYIDGEYIMYDYSTSELLEVKQALQGEDKE